MDLINTAQHPHYRLIELAIGILTDPYDQRVPVDDLAERLGVSASHLQHQFKQWAGLSITQFVQATRREHALQAIAQTSSLIEASLQTGLSGPGRLHDLTVKLEAASPGEIKSGGAGLAIEYGCGQTPLGLAFVASTARGICSFHFLDSEFDESQALASLSKAWPNALLTNNHTMANRVCSIHFGLGQQQKVFVKGSAFQIKVWQALLELPAGGLATYSDLAKMCGHPGAARAVGTAVAANPVGWLIPCHRVIRQTGVFGQYRWGAERKVALHLWEIAHEHSTPMRVLPKGTNCD